MDWRLYCANIKLLRESKDYHWNWFHTNIWKMFKKNWKIFSDGREVCNCMRHYNGHILMNKLIHFFRSGTHDTCFRCLEITSRSQNILGMKVQSLDSCFINSNHALEACPKLYQNTQEIFLIRKYYLLTQYKIFYVKLNLDSFRYKSKSPWILPIFGTFQPLLWRKWKFWFMLWAIKLWWWLWIKNKVSALPAYQ